MEISEIELEEIRVRLALDHDDLVHEEDLGEVLELEEMHQARLIGREREERVLDMGLTVYLGESIDIADIRLVDEQGRVGGEDELRSDILIDLLYHPCEASLHLGMEMDLRLVHDNHAVLEIIAVHGQNHGQEGLLSIAEL